MNKNEKNILFIIKYTPPIFIIAVSIIIFLSLYTNSNIAFKKEKARIEQEFIQENKDRVKEEITNIYKYILNQQKNTENDLKRDLKNKVYSAYKLAMNIYHENKHLDKKIVTKMIKDALRKVRFNDDKGYFFIYSLKHECILLPIFPKLEGKSFYNHKDTKNKYVVRDLVNIGKNKKEGFDKWTYAKPTHEKKWFEKIGFVKYFEPFQWVIGTGEYIEDHENKIKKKTLSYMKNLEFNKNYYIFALDKDMNYLNHALNEYVGKNAFEVKNLNEDTLKQMQNILKTKQEARFITYTQHIKPSNKKSIKKISYITKIPNWNWIIGKGFYADDIQKKLLKKKRFINEELKKSINNLATYTILLCAILLFISVYISKLLEERFKKYKLEIEENIEEMNKQYNILAHQGKMAAIGEMIGNIAHQWRQPLSLISTASSGLRIKKELNILEDKEFYENLDYINNSTQYLSQTIDDFRNFFSKDKQCVEFTIEEVLNDTLNIVGTQFKSKGISIHQNLESTKIKGLKTEFIQVIINILNNSKDELTKLKNQRKLILIDTTLEKNHLKILIKDNAGGANKNVLKSAFNPYFTEGKKDGTGIGLYMSKSIIEKHMNGKIYMQNSQFKFDNENYKGALTIIELPIST